jgi:hypothetical protein
MSVIIEESALFLGLSVEAGAGSVNFESREGGEL